MTETESRSTRLLGRQTTGEDRVRMVARELSESWTASWIASESGWSHEPAKRTLRRLGSDEEDRRREIAREWEHLQRRIKIIGFAIREWDVRTPISEPTEANS